MLNYNEYELIKEIPTEERPLIIENYPYGFRLKTKIAYWIETKKRQQRFCSKTLNPKTNLWNKPKYSTYSDLIVLGKEKTTEHILNLGFSLAYSNKEEYDTFITFLNGFETDYIKTFKKFAVAVFETRKYIKFSVVDVTNETETERQKREEKQKENSETLKQIFVLNAKKQGLNIEVK
jgi:hypothetical protein